MSERPLENAPTDAPIDFDRAEIPDASGASGGAPAVECRLCKRAITTEYWELAGNLLCGSCRLGFEASKRHATSGATFAKATLAAAGVAVVCGAGYAVFVGVTSIQFALITIGIGWAVGRTIHHFTRGLGDVRYQVVAVLLTYVGGSMGYLGAIVGALSRAAARDLDVSPLALGLTVARVLVEAPFLELKQGVSGVLGLAILFFGMQTAWRVSKGAVASLTGPHRVRADAE